MQIFHKSKRYAVALLATLFLAACAGMPVPQSPDQAFFAAEAAYTAVAEEVADYVTLPDADPKIKEAAKVVDAKAYEAVQKGRVALMAFNLLPEDRASRLEAAAAVLRIARGELAKQLMKIQKE